MIIAIVVLLLVAFGYIAYMVFSYLARFAVEGICDTAWGGFRRS